MQFDSASSAKVFGAAASCSVRMISVIWISDSSDVMTLSSLCGSNLTKLFTEPSNSIVVSKSGCEVF